MKHTCFAATAASVVIFLGGCESMTAGAEPPPLDGTAWVLSSLPGRTLLAGPRATAQFEAGRVQGSDGCNRFTAPYTTKGSAIQVGQGASTQMACPPETMQQAAAFMAALSGAKSYRINNGALQLLAADGAVLSSFAKQSQSLAGTAWHATGINNGRQAVVSLVAGSSVTMEFAADGKVSGTAGCNRYTASYQADGRKLRFGPAAATRKMCVAAGVMEQEQAFLKALETVATMHMEGDRLDLRTADDALAVALTRNGGS